MGLGHLSTNNLYGIVTPMSGTVKNLYGYSVLKPGMGSPETIAFQLLVDNKLTDLKCTIREDENCSNLMESYDVKAGQTLSMLVFASSNMMPTEVGASLVLENASTQDLNKTALHE